jgi:hypothetical protein
VGRKHHQFAFCTNWVTTQEERRSKEMNKTKIEEIVFTISNSNTPGKNVGEMKMTGLLQG